MVLSSSVAVPLLLFFDPFQIHFDHVGNNFEFAHDSRILMGGRDPRTTKNIELFSLCCAHGAKVKPFEVTRWVGGPV